ncbi:hypothetical protein WN944_007337 [Citrus x changshan-huyou]|uniref:Uncharacterized protein n=1 Tax=Citrus x changshan-huyou TaxID=2935761 RepID=A0AAP0MNG7_9ROSI
MGPGGPGGPPVWGPPLLGLLDSFGGFCEVIGCFGGPMGPPGPPGPTDLGPPPPWSSWMPVATSS